MSDARAFIAVLVLLLVAVSATLGLYIADAARCVS